MAKSLGLEVSAAVVALLIIFLGTSERAFAEDPPSPPGTPTARSFSGTRTVGALFANGLDEDHGCTASVIASRTDDLVITAAHCLDGTGAGYLFAPGYNHGRTPYGAWPVVHAFLPPGWLQKQDPLDDVAILQVARKSIDGHSIGVQNVVGANPLGTEPRPDTLITVVSYNAGSEDQPITCTTKTYQTSGYPHFNCRGYVGGSSGSPWLSGVPGSRLRVVRGVIGGLEQGGCYDYTSHSSPFGADVAELYRRAVAEEHPDSAPAADDDGC